jgi:hypothetical protein
MYGHFVRVCKYISRGSNHLVFVCFCYLSKHNTRHKHQNYSTTTILLDKRVDAFFLHYFFPSRAPNTDKSHQRSAMWLAYIHYLPYIYYLRPIPTAGSLPSPKGFGDHPKILLGSPFHYSRYVSGRRATDERCER